MCTILLRLAPGTSEPVVLAANRDEARDRPADDPAAIAPGVFAGRDRRAGGTWLALGPAGLAAVTNVSEAVRRLDAQSRGGLPLAALAGRLPASFADYNAFNLLVVDGDGARVWTHRGDGRVVGPTSLGAGDHVILNETFAGAPSARAAAIARLLAAGAPDFTLLAAHGPPPEHSLCHHGSAYGTVSSTLIALGPNGRVIRYWHRAGLPCAAPSEDLTAAARAATGRT